MKKFVLACGAVAMMAMTSCGNGASTQSDKTGIGDSLAMTFGALQGANFDQYYNGLSDAEKAKISKDDILKGLKATLFVDTTNQGLVMGQNIGMSFLGEITQIERMSNIRIDRQKLYDAFAQALKADSVTDMAALNAQMSSLSGKIREEMESYRKEQTMAKPEVQQNIKAGQSFVAKAKKEDPSIKTTESGLSYKVVTEGNGPKVKATDKVKLKYTGKLVDGTEFDSSKGEAVEMMPGQVIPGFKEGLLMMNKGSKYVLYIPGDLAYGANGIPGKIDPMSTLVFEVEVVDIVDDQPAIELPSKAKKVQ